MKNNFPTSGAAIVDEVKASARSFISEWEAEARRCPLKAAGYALGIGFILRLLPIRQIIFALFRLVLVFMKPTAFALGFYKLYELMIGREWKAAASDASLHSAEMGE